MSTHDSHPPGEPSQPADDHTGALAPTGGNRLVALPVSSWPASVAPRPEILASGANAVDLLHAFRRRWIQAVGVGLVVASIAAAVVWFVVPTRYEVAALLKVSSQSPVVRQRSGGGADADFATYKRTQSALIRSHFVLHATIRKPEIARLPIIQQQSDDAVGWLEKNLIVEYPSDAEILKISMRGDKPDQLVKLVNAVKDSYMDEIVNAEREEQMRRRETLEQNYQKNREEIRGKLTALYQLTRQLGTSNNETAMLKRRLATEHLEMLSQRRNRIEEQIRDIRMKIILAEKRGTNIKTVQIPDYILENEYAKDSVIASANRRLMQLRDTLAADEHQMVNKSTPRINRMKSEIARISDEIEERKITLRPVLIDQLSAGHGSTMDNVNMLVPLLETEHEAYKAELDEVVTARAKQFEEVQKLEAYSADIETRRAELDELQSITKEMGYELRILQVEFFAKPRITLIENASSPSGNDALKRLTGVGAAGLLGFGLAVLGISWFEFRSRRLDSANEVTEGLGIQVLGRLPKMSGRAWRKMQSSPAGHSRLHGLLAESVDSIRTTLIHTTSVDSPRMIMVTSADAHEGKTTVASQLAASLARSGRRTLLVDGDVRSPAAHRVFELPQEPGLCELLRRQVDTETAVHPTRSANLWVMPAGRCDMQSVQALSGESLTQAADNWRSQFDFVVIDAGPVLKVADPLLLGQHVDATILSVLRDVSQIPKIYEASQRLQSVGINVLGAVVNGVNERMQGKQVETALLETV